MMAPILLLLSALTWAQEPPAAEPATAQPATAQPATEEPAPAEPAPVEPAPVAPTAPAPSAAPPPVAAPPQPLAIPATPPAALTPERLAALRSYKAHRLAVRDELVVRGGGYSVVGGGWGSPWGPYGPWGYGYGSTMVLPEPTQVNRVWALYQGRERLDTLRFLELTQQADLRLRVQSDIQRYKRRSTVWFSLAGVGAGGIVGGMVALDLARTRDQAVTANRVLLGGSALASVGLIAGSFPRAKAEALRLDPRATLQFTTAQELADAHNERLRDELGLAPADVWAIESGAEDR